MQVQRGHGERAAAVASSKGRRCRERHCRDLGRAVPPILPHHARAPFASSPAGSGHSSASTLDVLIAAAGPVGTSLALALSREGLKVGLCWPPAPARCARCAHLCAQCRRGGAARAAGPGRAAEDGGTAVSDMQIRGDDGGALEFSAWQQWAWPNWPGSSTPPRWSRCSARRCASRRMCSG